MSGELHLADSRVATQVVAALYRNIPDVERIADLYPGIHAHSVGEAIEFERSFAA